MTTATQKPSPAVETVKPAAVLYQGSVAIDKIDVGDNIRKKFNPVKLAELTESIRRGNGPDTPVLLRPGAKPGRYELVAGARRLRACKTIGLADIPAIVKDLTAQQAAESQAIENIQREDLDPIDEARGFKVLLDGGKYTVDQLRQRIDKSLNYVYRSIRLLDLPKDLLGAIEDGQLTPAHGLQILRLPTAEQDKLVKQLVAIKGMTATDLRYRVESQLGCDLDSAQFPKNQPYAGKSACSVCPSNTGNQNVLFDGAEKGTCMDRPCYTAKTKQYKADFLEKVTLANLGAKFVEYARGHVYAGTMRTGGYVARAKLDPKKALKGVYGLLISSDGAVWVAVPDKQAADVMGATTEAKPEDPKIAYTDAAIRDALYAAAATAAKKLKPERQDWIDLAMKAANDLPNKMWAAVLGVDPDAGDDGDFKKAPEATLRAIVLLNNRIPYHPGDADFKKLGVDVVQVKKEAKKAAEQQWVVEHAVHMAKDGTLGKESVCGLKNVGFHPEPGQGRGTDGTSTPNWDTATCTTCLKKGPKK